ncbi:MAG TPA: hypothetical protein VK815_08500 [Candidatus Acidoferrales bacterium]|nr:hypothetical protein [Candidatus Acidoferrales bacterium]
MGNLMLIDGRRHRSLPFSIILVFFMFLPWATRSQQATREDTMLNKVRKVTILNYIYVEGQTNAVGEPLKFTKEFDRRGNLIKQVGYRGQTDTPTLEWNYEYDAKDNQTSAITIDATGLTKGSRGTASYRYDSKGRTVEGRSMDGNGKIVERKTFRWNANGKVGETLVYDASDQLTEKQESKYDPAGNSTGYDEFDPGGHVKKSVRYTLNAKGNATKSVIRGEDGKIVSTTDFSYDAEGTHLLDQVECDANGQVVTHTTYKRNAKGLVIEEWQRNGKGETSQRTEYMYELYN